MDWFQLVANIAQIIGVLWALIFGGKTILEAKKSFTKTRHIQVSPLIILNLLVACIVVILLGIFFRPTPSTIASSPLPSKDTSSTSIISPSPTSSSSTPILVSTVLSNPSPTLETALEQPIPDCNNPAGTVWSPPLPQTLATCQANGLQIQQQGTSYYAEEDLDNIKGTTYNQTIFRVQVQLSYQNINDAQTSAGLIIQTPQAQGVAGGYIFALTCAGNWILQKVQDGGTIPTVRHGTVPINAAEPILLTVSVQNGLLNGFINSHQVINNYAENLPTQTGASAIGLIVERPGNPSSSVFFSGFKLDD